MATLNGEITRIENDKAAIKAAIETKGGTVGESLDTYAQAIANLPTNGGSQDQFGHITYLDENNQEQVLYLNIDEFLELCNQIDQTSTIHFQDISIPKKNIIAYDTGDELDVLLPYMFEGNVWDEETGETQQFYSGLKTIRLGAKITTIPHDFARGASNLETIEMGPVENIGYNFLQSSQANPTFTLPTTLKVIGDGFLQYAPNFNHVLTIPASVTTIGTNFLFNVNQFTELVVYSEAIPTDVMALGTGDPNTPIYTTGVTITGPTSEVWMTALPNSKVYPYRKIIGNPEPIPYIRYWTQSGGDTPNEVYDEGSAKSMIMAGLSETWYWTSDTTKIELTERCSTLNGVTRVLLGQTVRQGAPIVNISGMEYCTEATTVTAFYYLPELESVGLLPPNVIESNGTQSLFEECPKFNAPITIPASYSWQNTRGGLVPYIVKSCATFNSPITYLRDVVEGTIITLCPMFDSIIDLPANISSINCLAENCQSFNQPIDFGSAPSLIFTGPLLNGCHSYAQPVTFPASSTFATTSFLPNISNLTSIIVDTPNLPNGGALPAEEVLTNVNSTSPAYTRGVAVSGAFGQQWRETFTQLDGPYYRKLVAPAS